MAAVATPLLHFAHLVLISELEPVAKCSHVGILSLEELVRLGNHPDYPSDYLGASGCFEAKMEVAGMLGVDAESIRRPVGIGIDVGRQPFFCNRKIV